MSESTEQLNTVAIRAILNQDRVWAAYALADLQPAFAPYCQWQLGESVEGAGVVLLFTALQPPIVFTMGAQPAVRAALWRMNLPEEIYLTVPLAHYPTLAELYSFRGTAHPMQRLLLRDRSQMSATPAAGLSRLNAGHSEQLRVLYAHGGEFAPDYFEPYQLDDGVYFGVLGEDGALLAAGGTHIVDRVESIAAIGNMYTHPDQRGRGYGSQILQAIGSTLVSEGFDDIFLNVHPRNTRAHKLYQCYGFADYCRFMEGAGIRRR